MNRDSAHEVPPPVRREKPGISFRWAALYQAKKIKRKKNLQRKKYFK
jgi:N-acetyl-anhydromuramyl-L-alanine amidase AmpD